VNTFKHKQHYVWEHYLKAWAIDGHLWCRRGEKRFPASTENIAHCRDFYCLKEMSERDFEVVDLLISPMNEPLRSLAKGWVALFRLPHEAKRLYKASGQRNLELEHELDVDINNTEEDLHASVEEKVIPILAPLREGDSGILDNDQHFLQFARFIGMQYMRTPRIMRRSIEGMSAMPGAMPGFNVEASWGLLRTIFATNIGGSLFFKRRTLRLTFLNAPAGAELVTGDQPIVNARAVGLADGAQATEVEYYYPLTPERALLMDFDYTHALTERRSLTVDETVTYNKMIVAASEEQVYARSENALIAATARRG
jgi:hypothetical protein